MSAGAPDRPARVRLLAPAKVNLSLDVLGRRDDGYHELRTWMAALELADELELERTRTGTVELELRGPCATADVPVDGTNLAVRAARGVLERARRAGLAAERDGVRLVLEKRVPSQAGLGGASADAAAAWLGCEALFGAELPATEREAALAALGSDCVFFVGALSSGLALCEGRGERVAPSTAAAPAWHVVVITPEVRCPTAAVYAAFEKRLRRSGESHSLPRKALGAPARDARRWFSNDLEAAALEATPGLSAWREALDAAGAEHFLLSGSGSSFYGVFDDPDDARRASEAVLAAARARELEHRGCWLTKPSGWGLKFLTES